MLRQGQDVGWPVAQWRHGHFDDIQLIVEVFEEAAGDKLGLQVAVGGREDTNVAAPRLRFSHPFVAPLLEQPQELRLQSRGQIADFAEQKGAAFREGHLSHRIPHGTGNPALHVPEEFALQELSGKTCAVNGDQRIGGARAAGMDRPGQDILASTAFAAKQDGCLADRGLEGHVQGLAYSRLARLEFHLGRDQANLLLQRVDSGQGLGTIAGFDVSVSKHLMRLVVNNEHIHGRYLSLLNRVSRILPGSSCNLRCKKAVPLGGTFT